MAGRNKIISFLEAGDFDGLAAAFKEGPGMFRSLISLSYDKKSLVCWRAIEGIGIVTAELTKTDPEMVRSLAQRLIWMMRDESGNNTGSAPEILGEIVRNCPDDFEDIGPIIASFHDEEMLRKGVLRALWRIGEIRPDLCGPAPLLVGLYIKSPDPELRAYAALVAGVLGLRDFISEVEELAADNDLVTIYREGKINSVPLSKIAGETVIMLRMERTESSSSRMRIIKPPADDMNLKCPFCSCNIGQPAEIETRFGSSFTGGSCSCGAVYVYDRSGHNLGDSYVDALTYACSDAVDVWGLIPGEDYEIREMSFDKKRNRFISGGKKAAATYLFIMMNKAGKRPERPQSATGEKNN